MQNTNQNSLTDDLANKQQVITALISLFGQSEHSCKHYRTIAEAMYTAFFEYDDLVNEFVNNKKESK